MDEINTPLKTVLLIIMTLMASIVLFWFFYGDTTREFFYNASSKYFNSTITDYSYNQGLRITETKDDLFDNTQGSVYRAEG